jgi:hypothetical protein
MMVKLSLSDQYAFCSFNRGVIFPVPGGWGRHGSTFIDLKKVKKSVFKDALTAAWKTMASPKLKLKYFENKKLNSGVYRSIPNKLANEYIPQQMVTGHPTSNNFEIRLLRHCPRNAEMEGFQGNRMTDFVIFGKKIILYLDSFWPKSAPIKTRRLTIK